MPDPNQHPNFYIDARVSDRVISLYSFFSESPITLSVFHQFFYNFMCALAVPFHIFMFTYYNEILTDQPKNDFFQKLTNYLPLNGRFSNIESGRISKQNKLYHQN